MKDILAELLETDILSLLNFEVVGDSDAQLDGWLCDSDTNRLKPLFKDISSIYRPALCYNLVKDDKLTLLGRICIILRDSYGDPQIKSVVDKMLKAQGWVKEVEYNSIKYTYGGGKYEFSWKS